MYAYMPATSRSSSNSSVCLARRGPDNGKEKFDNLTLSEYIADMEGFLPHHAFNAYDQVNAANVIVKQEGFIINSTGHNKELAEEVSGPDRETASLAPARSSRPLLLLSLANADTSPAHLLTLSGCPTLSGSCASRLVWDDPLM